MTIHKQTSLNFDDKKYIILAQTHGISITVLYDIITVVDTRGGEGGRRRAQAPPPPNNIY